MMSAYRVSLPDIMYPVVHHFPHVTALTGSEYDDGQFSCVPAMLLAQVWQYVLRYIYICVYVYICEYMLAALVA